MGSVLVVLTVVRLLLAAVGEGMEVRAALNYGGLFAVFYYVAYVSWAAEMGQLRHLNQRRERQLRHQHLLDQHQQQHQHQLEMEDLDAFYAQVREDLKEEHRLQGLAMAGRLRSLRPLH
jgi:uncharacterized protein YlxW (UPF0749 family)